MSKTSASSVGRKFVGEQTIPTTVAWSGTPPTGETKLYNWSQDFARRMVMAVLHLFYTGAGTTNTSVTIPLPSDMPLPLVPTGMTGANVILYTGTAMISTAINAGNANALQSTIRRNAADTGFNIVGTVPSVSAKYATITISYYY